jgi:hypothetical protein
MKRMLVVCLLVLGPIQCEAQPFGKMGHYLAHHKELILADAVVIAAWSVDAASTEHDLHICPGCVETNPLLNAHPSTRDVWLVALGSAGAQMTLGQMFWHRENRRVYQHLIWAPVAASVSLEGRYAWQNAQIGESATLPKASASLLVRRFNQPK